MDKPLFITFTGLDEAASTQADRIVSLSRRYPIEWGILFSTGRQGIEPRYPTDPVIRTFLPLPIRRAAHLCGPIAREIVRTGECPHLDELLAGNFDRIQVNTSDPTVDPERVARYAASLGEGTRAILQSRDPVSFPAPTATQWLYDRSGGRGDIPDRWPVPAIGGAMVGYAGGLGPGTVAPALDAILASHPAGVPFWIDMETRIRTDDRLDLDLCEAVCRAVYGEGDARMPAGV